MRFTDFEFAQVNYLGDHEIRVKYPARQPWLRALQDRMILARIQRALRRAGVN
jgi:hypothetical protein